MGLACSTKRFLGFFIFRGVWHMHRKLHSPGISRLAAAGAARSRRTSQERIHRGSVPVFQVDPLLICSVLLEAFVFILEPRSCFTAGKGLCNWPCQSRSARQANSQHLCNVSCHGGFNTRECAPCARTAVVLHFTNQTSCPCSRSTPVCQLTGSFQFAALSRIDLFDRLHVWKKAEIETQKETAPRTHLRSAP